MKFAEYDLKHDYLTRNDWNDALQVQNASNLSGVVNSMLILIKKIRQEAEAQGRPWSWVDRHPILRMFAYKISALCGMEDVSLGVSDEWEEMEAFVKDLSVRRRVAQ